MSLGTVQKCLGDEKDSIKEVTKLVAIKTEWSERNKGMIYKPFIKYCYVLGIGLATSHLLFKLQ